MNGDSKITSVPSIPINPRQRKEAGQLLIGVMHAKGNFVRKIVTQLSQLFKHVGACHLVPFLSLQPRGLMLELVQRKGASTKKRGHSVLREHVDLSLASPQICACQIPTVLQVLNLKRHSRQSVEGARSKKKSGALKWRVYILRFYCACICIYIYMYIYIYIHSSALFSIQHVGIDHSLDRNFAPSILRLA